VPGAFTLGSFFDNAEDFPPNVARRAPSVTAAGMHAGAGNQEACHCGKHWHVTPFSLKFNTIMETRLVTDRFMAKEFADAV
jgi:hypothetical protein